MKIDIKRFGLTDIPVDPDTVFTFPEGLQGLETCKRFKMFHEENKPTVFWLKSLDDTGVMFSIVSPELANIEYQIELSDADVALLGMKHPEDVMIAIVLYRNDADNGRISANTLAPLILNMKNRKGIQKILREMHPTLLYRGR
jgi:flagellar assembly factor FliW